MLSVQSFALQTLGALFVKYLAATARCPTRVNTSELRVHSTAGGRRGRRHRRQTLNYIYVCAGVVSVSASVLCMSSLPVSSASARPVTVRNYRTHINVHSYALGNQRTCTHAYCTYYYIPQRTSFAPKCEKFYTFFAPDRTQGHSACQWSTLVTDDDDDTTTLDALCSAYAHVNHTPA